MTRPPLLRRAGWYRDAGSTEGAHMPITDQFWEYAREAVLSASQADTDDDRRNLLELAWIWTGAALAERRSVIDNNKIARAA